MEETQPVEKKLTPAQEAKKEYKEKTEAYNVKKAEFEQAKADKKEALVKWKELEKSGK